MTSKGPQFPLYVPTKGRHEFLMTSKSLSYMGVHHNLVVEPDEVAAYTEAVEREGVLATIVPLDMAYKQTYELCDDLGLSRSTGPGPARNFAWEHSKANGHEWHWVMDDNIRGFKRMHKKQRIKVKSPSFWRLMEDFVLRYTNVGMAGPNYSMFAFGASRIPPFITNTRIYSCNLIRNDLPFRWRGRYNEDTILSLDMLTHGWCTIQFNAFLQEKIGTQTMKGGNTQEFYHAEGKVDEKKAYADGGTTAKSQMLADVYPQYCEVKWKFNRVHHQVNYTPFKSMGLVRRDDYQPIEAPTLKLVRKADDERG